MWFLTIDPFIRISFFIAKLSKRQYCWRVFEDIHSQEHIQFFDIHCRFFMRLHFSIGGYDYRMTTRFRQGIHFSAIQVLLLLVMCIDAPESTTNSRSSSVRVDADRHLFSEGEKNVALSCSFNFNTLLASFHAASRAPFSCHSVSSKDRSSNFGALGLRWWGSPGQVNANEGLWFRISVWRAMAFVNFTRWIDFCMSDLLGKIDVHFGGSMSWKTQPNCRAFDDLHWKGPWFDSWRVSRFTTGCTVPSCSSWSIVILVGNRSSFLPITFLQKSHSTFVIIIFGPFSRLFINLTMCEWALFPKPTTTLGLVEQAFRMVPLFEEWIGASSFEVTLAWPSRHSTTGTLASGTLGSRRFSLLLLHAKIGDGFDGETFPRLLISWRKLQLSPFTHCPSISYHSSSQVSPVDRDIHRWQVLFLANFPFST